MVAVSNGPMMLLTILALLHLAQSIEGGGAPAVTPGIIAIHSGSCSNKLDFSQACNSQYVGIM